MHTQLVIHGWSVSRSGPTVTVKGKDAAGQDIKVPNVRVITPDEATGTVVATDVGNQRFELAVPASGVDPLVRDAVLSDLFFNQDLESAKLTEAGEFKGWNEEKLLELAHTFRHRMKSLGVRNVPGSEEIVRDFHERC
jgi:hypothetical protein